ncbi:MAG: ADP-ribosylglycohydrolase family protein, partial [Balneolales bacterium]|nr:ADP-ribosylglycohydrolase family protein [Balneolales bacterium]
MRTFFFSILLYLSSTPLIAQPSLDDKIYGLLIGSAIGDASGGPTEFAAPERSFWTTTDQKITSEGLEELGALFKLSDYPRTIEPFGVWDHEPPAGTITDDTRFKMIFFDALEASEGKITKKDLARATLDFGNQLPEKYHAIYEEWMTEIGFASRWVLGERDNAYPTERIWGGVPTV